MKFLYDYLLSSANSGLAIQMDDGSFGAGCNGPHDQQETEVRNTSHWLITLSKAFELTGDEKYFIASNLACDYLLSNKVRPFGFSFYCRNDEGLDKANGLIGQAWPIEALAIAGEILNREDAVRVATEVFLMHDFDHKIGLWKIKDIDGREFRTIYDLVINHQLWFAASGSELLNTLEKIDKKRYHVLNNLLVSFINRLNKNLRLSKKGYLKHNIPFYKQMLFKNPSLLFKTNDYYLYVRSKLLKKEKIGPGYHAFHTYALGVLKEKYPDHKLWKSDIIKESIRYLTTESYVQDVIESKYGLNYNPPGIEIAYTLYSLADSRHDTPDDLMSLISDWVKFQFEKTWNKNHKMINNVKYDPLTYAARIYEAWRIPNLKINLNE